MATSAPIHGPRWGARAADWAQLCAGFSQPAWNAVADSTRIRPGVRVLDVGCGSGEFCALASARGAVASGIDAADGMIAVARHRAPAADLRVGAMEHLPWDDATFDVVCGFNAFQFAADPGIALADARRVTRPGGRLAVCAWRQPPDSDLFAVYSPLPSLGPDPPRASAPAKAPDELLRDAGLEPRAIDEIDVPWHVPDRMTLARALLAPGSAAPAIAHAGEEAVRDVLLRAAAPFGHSDGSYRFENHFTYAIATVPSDHDP